MVSHRLLNPLCAGYDRPEGVREGEELVEGRGNGSNDSVGKHRDLSRSFDDAVGWLFAYAGDALRDPFAPPPPTEVAVMTGTRLDVRVANWVEVCASCSLLPSLFG